MRLPILAALVIAAPLAAQSAPPQSPPKVCETQPERRQFDFWIGEWEVRTVNGAVAGKSSVQSISGGCALLENWTSSNGGNGKSINAYKPAIKQWQQYWIGQDGNPVEFRESTFDGKSIAFIARMPAMGNTPAGIMRLTFTPMPDGTVRQHGENSTDDGKTWSTQYDFRYHRVK